MITYGRSFAWGGTELTTQGHPSQNEATHRLAYLMVLSGYTLPKWHEISRWDEKRPALDLRSAIETQLNLIAEK